MCVCFQISGVFASFGLSGIIPAIHYGRFQISVDYIMVGFKSLTWLQISGLMEGWFNKISQASLGWLILMGKLEYH